MIHAVSLTQDMYIIKIKIDLYFLDVTEPAPGPSGIASQIITDSAVIVTLDEGTSAEQEMTIPIVSMDHILRITSFFNRTQ